MTTPAVAFSFLFTAQFDAGIGQWTAGVQEQTTDINSKSITIQAEGTVVFHRQGTIAGGGTSRLGRLRQVDQ